MICGWSKKMSFTQERCFSYQDNTFYSNFFLFLQLMHYLRLLRPLVGGILVRYFWSPAPDHHSMQRRQYSGFFLRGVGGGWAWKNFIDFIAEPKKHTINFWIRNTGSGRQPSDQSIGAGQPQRLRGEEAPRPPRLLDRQGGRVCRPGSYKPKKLIIIVQDNRFVNIYHLCVWS